MAEVKIVSLDRLTISELNERKTSIEADDLKESIEQRGFKGTIQVRPTDAPNADYEIVAGQRRFLGAKQAGLDEIDVQVEDMSDEDALSWSIGENSERQDVDPVDRARQLQRLWEEMGGSGAPSAKKLAGKTGKHPNTIRRWLEPLKWKGTPLYPDHHGGSAGDSSDATIDVSDVGESTLSKIRNIDTSRENQVALARRVADRQDTQESITNLKRQVQDGETTVDDYLSGNHDSGEENSDTSYQKSR